MNTDKSTILQAFNTNFFSFMDDIISVFPENTDIITAKKFFEITKKANPTIIIKIWYSHIQSQYSYAIEEGDISFFYEKNYADDLVHLVNSKEIMRTIDTLREPIRNMSEENKKHSMDYIQILSKLSDMYNKMTLY